MKIDIRKISGIEWSILRAYRIKKKRNWDRLFVAVDLHDTITKSSYTKNEVTKKEFLPEAIEALRYMTGCKELVLILYTSSFKDYLKEYYGQLEEKGVYFKYLNENPECPSTDTGDFSSKFYFNILLDDKSGFYPKKDWVKIHRLIQALEEGNLEIIGSKNIDKFLDFN